MTLDEARATLQNSQSGPCELLEAAGTLASEQSSTLDDLMLGLRYWGPIAEASALALYRRTGRPIPPDPIAFVTSEDDWTRWLQDRGLLAAAGGSRA